MRGISVHRGLAHETGQSVAVPVWGNLGPTVLANTATGPKEAVEIALAETRKHGLSGSLGQPIPGIDALCAPVFDADGHIILGILVMGPSATFDNKWDGTVAKGTEACCP